MAFTRISSLSAIGDGEIERRLYSSQGFGSLIDLRPVYDLQGLVISGRRSEEWTPQEFGTYDAVLIITDHEDVDYIELASRAKLVIDTRNACRRAGVRSSKIVLA